MSFKPRCQKCGGWHWLEDPCISPEPPPKVSHAKPVRDERGRFCSFDTCCGRNCNPQERERCQWWTHASNKDIEDGK